MKEIDEFFRDYLRPTLKAAGFRRKGRLFYLGSPLDDVAVIETRGFPLGHETLGFWMKAALYPEPFRAFKDITDQPPNADWGLWHAQIGPALYGDPDAPDDDRGTWDVPKTEKAQWGEFLGCLLQRHLVPFLKQMLERNRLLEAIKSREFGTFVTDPFTVLVEEGRTSELAVEVARLQWVPEAEYRQKVADFLRNRLPPASLREERAFADAVVEARRGLAVRTSAPIIAVETGEEGVGVELADDRFFAGRTAYHARITAPDGRVTTCLAGPDSNLRSDGKYRRLVRISGLDANQIALGSVLRVSVYRADERDEAPWT